MQQCKIDHSLPDTLPAFLCALCHPENRPTQEQRIELAERDKQERVEADAELWRKQELMRLQSRLDGIMRRNNGDPGGIDARVAKSLQSRIERLNDTQDATIARQEAANKLVRKAKRRSAKSRRPITKRKKK